MSKDHRETKQQRQAFCKDTPIITSGAHSNCGMYDRERPVFRMVIGLGGAVRIVGPESLVEQMKQEIRRQAELY